MVVSSPVLALPNFSLFVEIECDVSGKIVEVVLMQNKHPIAFYSQGLKGMDLRMSIYEKEIFAIVLVVQKWRPYFLRRPFTIKTNHQSLKFLLDPKIGSYMQQKWVSKLISYDFVV